MRERTSYSMRPSLHSLALSLGPSVRSFRRLVGPSMHLPMVTVKVKVFRGPVDRSIGQMT